MKKIIFVLLVAVALFASCGDKAAKKEETATPQKYTIVGVDTEQADGTQVFCMKTVEERQCWKLPPFSRASLHLQER